MNGKAGRGNPPKDTRFRKGQSGNPKGRPKKKAVPTEESAFDIIMDKRLTVTRNGVPREMTVEEALLHKTYQEAIAGKARAQREIIRLILNRESAQVSKTASKGPVVSVVTEPTDPQNSNEALLILGIAGPDPRWETHEDSAGRLLLEPWAVQKALSRRRGGNALTASEIEEIKRCTRDPESLQWPRSAAE